MSSSADRINLGELTSQLANAEARVCEWASAAGKRADAARLEHGRRIAALRGKKKRPWARRAAARSPVSSSACFGKAGGDCAS